MAGRPRTFDRDQALDCALDAFWRSGYAGTSVADLTAAIGINPPSLYAAFGDKESLFRQATERYVERLNHGLLVALDEPTARAGVEALLRAAAFFHTEHGMPPGCLVLGEPRLAAERRDLRDTIAARFERGRGEGDVPADADPNQLAQFVTTVLAGMSARARDGAGYDELLATAQLAVAALPQSVLPPR